MSVGNQAYVAPLRFELRAIGFSVLVHAVLMFAVIYCYGSALEFLYDSYHQLGIALPPLAGTFLRWNAEWQSNAMAMVGAFGLVMAADAVIGLCVMLYYSETGRRNWSIWTGLAILLFFAYGIFSLLFPVRSAAGF